MTSISSVLDCLVPQGYCSSESLERGTFQLFIIFGIIYNLFTIAITSMLRLLVRELKG
jgi:ABC-type amino acid transport system permease subunit